MGPSWPVGPLLTRVHVQCLGRTAASAMAPLPLPLALPMTASASCSWRGSGSVRRYSLTALRRQLH